MSFEYGEQRDANGNITRPGSWGVKSTPKEAIERIVENFRSLKDDGAMTATWDNVLNKPTTLAGYGITDVTDYTPTTGMRVLRDVGAFYSIGDSVVGTLKITLPTNWNSTMLRMHLVGYQFVNGAMDWSADIGGYPHSTQQKWNSASATLSPNCPFSEVRFGHDGSYPCILLGTTTTRYRYPAIRITEVQGSYSGAAGMKSGWQIDIITNESGITISAEPTVKTLAIDGHTHNYAPDGFGLGDKITSDMPNYITNSNLDDIIITGFYYCGDTNTNKPSSAGHLTVVASSRFVTQIYHSISQNIIYTRKQQDDTWSAWETYAPGGFGLGGAAALFEGDWDDCRQSGFYRGSSLVHAPTTGSGHWYYVLTMGNGGTYAYQRAIGFSSAPKKSWERWCHSGVWTEWQEIPTVSHIPIKKYTISSSGAVQHCKLGTFSNLASGRFLKVSLYGGAGYNGDPIQTGVCDIYLKSGNGNAPNLACTYAILGNPLTASNITIVPVGGAGGAANWELYLTLPAHCGTGAFYTVQGDIDRWTNAMSTVTAIPTAGAILGTITSFSAGTVMANKGIRISEEAADLWGVWNRNVTLTSNATATVYHQASGLFLGFHTQNKSFYFCDHKEQTHYSILHKNGLSVGSANKVGDANYTGIGLFGGAVGGRLYFYTGSTYKATIFNTAEDLRIMSGTDIPITFYFNASGRFGIDNTSFRPLTDNAFTVGHASYRIKQIYAATATISTSDRNAKTDIADTSLGLDFINALRPVEYRYKVKENQVTREEDGVETVEVEPERTETRVVTPAQYETVVIAPESTDEDGNVIPAVTEECLVQAEVTEQVIIPAITEERPKYKDVVTPIAGVRTHVGLIAQDVEAALGSKDIALFTKDEETGQYGLRYEEFVAPLIKAVQELSMEVAELKRKVG